MRRAYRLLISTEARSMDIWAEDRAHGAPATPLEQMFRSNFEQTLKSIGMGAQVEWNPHSAVTRLLPNLEQQRVRNLKGNVTTYRRNPRGIRDVRQCSWAAINGAQCVNGRRSNSGGTEQSHSNVLRSTFVIRNQSKDRRVKSY